MNEFTMIDGLKIITNNKDLTFEQALSAMNIIMDGNATDAQVAGFLIALKMKGETADEIAGFAAAMRKHSTKVLGGQNALDIVGTGGDLANTFNISTVSAVVISACGIPVAKHGSHSSSSKCGSADVLKELGVKLEVSPQINAQMLREIGICFMYAPRHHSSMKYVTPTRKQLGVPTLFNILGPMANPAGVSHQMIGAYSRELALKIARVLCILGVKNSRVISGDDGLDEVTLTTTTTVFDVVDGQIIESKFDPRDYGFDYCKTEDFVGGEIAENGEIARSILSGEKSAKRDMVLINSALAINSIQPETTIEEAVVLVKEAIDSGKAKKQLEKMIAFSNKGEAI